MIREEVKLPFLDRYLLVQVDCDGLDGESRRQLFPTTRETIRDSQIGDDLRRLIVEALSGDDQLRELDRKRKQKYLKSSSTPVEAIRRRLARRIKASLLTGGGRDGPRTAPPESTREHEDPAAIQVIDPPTFLRITSSAPRKVYPGKMFTVKFDTDARADYFSSLDHFIALVSPPTFGAFQGIASVREGHGTAYFRVTEDVDIGATAKVTLEVRPPRSASLSDSLDIETIELPQTTGENQGDARTPNINIETVERDDAYFIENEWDEKSVASVASDAESTTVFISVSNARLTSLFIRAQRKDNSTVETVRGFYLEHIAFYAVLDYITRRSKSDDSGDEQSENGARRDVSLVNACETVCGIMEALFEVLPSGGSESA